jgi:hypothetical protein
VVLRDDPLMLLHNAHNREIAQEICEYIMPLHANTGTVGCLKKERVIVAKNGDIVKRVRHPLMFCYSKRPTP